MCKNRLGWNGEPRFWCGFRQRAIHLQSGSLAAWSQRFNDIDIEHFKKDKRTDDWTLPSAHMAKVHGDDDAHVTRGRCGADGEPVGGDDSDADGYAEYGSPRENAMSVDQELSFKPP